MDKDRIKGKMEDIGGRVQRQVGEWTGDKKKQAEGLKHQIKGKMRNMAGQMKDAAREAQRDVDREQLETEEDLNIDREKGAA
jgi:uncharacterized protein YjbJ (UPF0337 family)